MTAYLIAQTEIHDHETYDRYKGQVLPIIQKFGGRFIVRGGSLRPSTRRCWPCANKQPPTTW